MTIVERLLNKENIPGLENLAQQEKIPYEKLVAGIKKGTIVVPKNNVREIPLCGIGQGLTTKVNANIGTSPFRDNIDQEIEKLKIAVKYGADAVMDLSTGSNLDDTRQQILAHSQVPIGTVPVYEAAAVANQQNKKFQELTEEELLLPIQRQAEQGVDFMTIHCGITSDLLENLKIEKRILGIVSRGGALMASWMRHNNCENPYYTQFDKILEICHSYDVTLSLGDGLRPGCQADANDGAQVGELMNIGLLVKRCLQARVQVMVEGPGHMRLDLIAGNVQLQKRICHQVPYYVLGPLATDIAPGYDHITGAIGGAIAASQGVDFLCYVTPAEHLRLPGLDDVRQGVIASKIAAHSGDLVKNVGEAAATDLEVSKRRATLDWAGQRDLVLDQDRFNEFRETKPTDELNPCSMCGDFCTYRLNPEDRQTS
jgi:phosphomethylpyrimidine synthase